MRTGRAEKPIPSASDPSTWSGRLWTGGGGGWSKVRSNRITQDEVGTWNIIQVGAHERATPYAANLPNSQLRPGAAANSALV